MDGQFSWLPTMVDWYLPIHIGLEFDAIFDIAIDEAADAIPADFVRRRGEIWSALRRSLQLHEAHPRTLLHNDSHLGNVYITAAGQAALCDWQCVCSGLWARDIAYAISTMLPVEDRRLWERDLVALYLDRMNEAAGRRIASFDEAWLLYRQQLVLILPSWLPTLHRHPDAPEMQPRELSLEMVRRVTTAMSDLGSFDA
jgi:aminoglycoside phosphotransferase (APT) family kinase protein